jgi:hypothetical protein
VGCVGFEPPRGVHAVASVASHRIAVAVRCA